MFRVIKKPCKRFMEQIEINQCVEETEKKCNSVEIYFHQLENVFFMTDKSQINSLYKNIGWFGSHVNRKDLKNTDNEKKENVISSFKDKERKNGRSINVIDIDYDERKVLGNPPYCQSGAVIINELNSINMPKRSYKIEQILICDNSNDNLLCKNDTKKYTKIDFSDKQDGKDDIFCDRLVSINDITKGTGNIKLEKSLDSDFTGKFNYLHIGSHTMIKPKDLFEILDSKENDSLNQKSNNFNKNLILLYLLPEEVFFLKKNWENYSTTEMTLSIKSLDSEENNILLSSLESIWDLCQSIDPDFGLKISVYERLRNKKWIPLDGSALGCNYVVYRNSPQVEHASHMVVIYKDNKNSNNGALYDGSTTNNAKNINWLFIQGCTRLAQNANKELLIYFTSQRNSISMLNYKTSITLYPIIFSRKSLTDIQ